MAYPFTGYVIIHRFGRRGGSRARAVVNQFLNYLVNWKRAVRGLPSLRFSCGVLQEPA